MHFDEIRNALSDAWAFAWPPVLMMLVFYLVARSLDAAKTSAMLGLTLERAHAYGTKLNSFRETLGPYGLTRLVPIISGVVVLAILFILNGPILQFSEEIPPYFIFTDNAYAQKENSDKALLVLIREFPAAGTFPDLYFQATVDFPPARNDSSALNVKLDGIIKFALFSSLLLFILGMSRTGMRPLLFLRFVAVVIVLSALWEANLLVMLKQTENDVYSEWLSTKAQAFKDAGSFLKDPPTDEEKARIKSLAFLPHRHWWHLEYGGTNIAWFERVFIADTMEGVTQPSTVGQLSGFDKHDPAAPRG